MTLMSFENKFKRPNLLKRDANILLAIADGVEYGKIAVVHRLTASRIRFIARVMAAKLIGREHRENPNVPLKYVFTREDYVGCAEQWHQRVKKYLPLFEKEFEE